MTIKAFLLAMAMTLGAGSAPAAPAGTDWPSWGNGLRFDRFSPADQINRTNVQGLRPVWKYALAQKGLWEITPIVIKGVMYGEDMQGTAFALEPETGRELWRFSTGQTGRMRAVSYWPGDVRHAPRIV